MTTGDLVMAAGATLVVGAAMAVVTLRVARRSVVGASVLAPVAVVLAMATGVLVGSKLMVIEGAERYFVMLLATSPVALAMGAVASVGSNRVISEKNAELDRARRAREVEAGRRELLAWLSHDIRTPLAGIQAMAEALQDGIAPVPGRYYAAIGTETQRTIEMVSDLMALASLQTNSMDVKREPVSINDIVSDLVAQLQPQADARGVVVQGTSTAGPAEVSADIRLLSRALQNVLVNAISYTQPETVVGITVSEASDAVLVSVTDSCGGLSEDDLTHAFDSGWRGDSARTPGGGYGSGLGLAIVAQIMAAHGGKVTLSNADHGCRVDLTIPRRFDHEGAPG